MEFKVFKMKITYNNELKLFSTNNRTIDTNYLDKYPPIISQVEYNIIDILTCNILGDIEYQYNAIKSIASKYRFNYKDLESDIYDSCDDFILINNPNPINAIEFNTSELKSISKRIIDLYKYLQKSASRLTIDDLQQVHDNYYLTALLSTDDTMVYENDDKIISLVLLDKKSFINKLLR